jgi:hypothetical protein
MHHDVKLTTADFCELDAYRARFIIVVSYGGILLSTSPVFILDNVLFVMINTHQQMLNFVYTIVVTNLAIGVVCMDPVDIDMLVTLNTHRLYLKYTCI